MFIFLAFRMKAKKTHFACGKYVLFFTRLLKKGFNLTIQPNHLDNKFPAFFGGIMLDHFLLESDPEKRSN